MIMRIIAENALSQDKSEIQASKENGGFWLDGPRLPRIINFSAPDFNIQYWPDADLQDIFLGAE